MVGRQALQRQRGRAVIPVAEPACEHRGRVPRALDAHVDRAHRASGQQRPGDLGRDDLHIDRLGLPKAHPQPRPEAVSEQHHRLPAGRGPRLGHGGVEYQRRWAVVEVPERPCEGRWLEARPARPDGHQARLPGRRHGDGGGGGEHLGGGGHGPAEGHLELGAEARTQHGHAGAARRGPLTRVGASHRERPVDGIYDGRLLEEEGVCEHDSDAALVLHRQHDRARGRRRRQRQQQLRAAQLEPQGGLRAEEELGGRAKTGAEDGHPLAAERGAHRGHGLLQTERIGLCGGHVVVGLGEAALLLVGVDHSHGRRALGAAGAAHREEPVAEALLHLGFGLPEVHDSAGLEALTDQGDLFAASEPTIFGVHRQQPGRRERGQLVGEGPQQRGAAAVGVAHGDIGGPQGTRRGHHHDASGGQQLQHRRLGALEGHLGAGPQPSPHQRHTGPTAGHAVARLDPLELERLVLTSACASGAVAQRLGQRRYVVAAYDLHVDDVPFGPGRSLRGQHSAKGVEHTHARRRLAAHAHGDVVDEARACQHQQVAAVRSHLLGIHRGQRQLHGRRVRRRVGPGGPIAQPRSELGRLAGPREHDVDGVSLGAGRRSEQQGRAVLVEELHGRDRRAADLQRDALDEAGTDGHHGHVAVCRDLGGPQRSQGQGCAASVVAFVAVAPADASNRRFVFLAARRREQGQGGQASGQHVGPASPLRLSGGAGQGVGSGGPGHGSLLAAVASDPECNKPGSPASR